MEYGRELEHMTWADCVAALEVGLQPASLLPVHVEGSAADVGVPTVPPTSYLYQRLTSGGMRSCQVVYLRPQFPFWEYMDANFASESHRQSADKYDDELSIDMASMFSPLFVSAPAFPFEQHLSLQTVQLPGELTTEGADRPLVQAETEANKEAHANDSIVSDPALDIERAVEAVRDIMLVDASQQYPTASVSMCKTFTVYQWSLLFQGLCERDGSALRESNALIRIVQTVGTPAIGEWIMFGYTRDACEGREWADAHGRAEQKIADMARLPCVAAQCLQGWTCASLRSRLERDFILGDRIYSAAATFVACTTLKHSSVKIRN
jgi:hypothetical protein